MTVLDTNLKSTPEKPFIETALRYGLICGGAAILLQLLMYLTDFNMMTIMGGLSLMVISLLMNGFIAAKGVEYQRDKLDGKLISFGKAFMLAGLIVLIGGVISTTWNMIFSHLIVPDYVDSLKQQFSETYGEMMSQEQMEKALADIENQQSIGQALKIGMIASIIFSAIIGLIVAAIMKREPEYPLGR